MQNDQSLSIDALSSNLPNSNNCPSDEMCSATRTHVLSTPITRVSPHVSFVVSNVRNVSRDNGQGFRGQRSDAKSGDHVMIPVLADMTRRMIGS